MSHPLLHDSSDDEVILKAKPKRPFSLSSPPPSAPSTPPLQSPALPPHLQTPENSMDGSSTPSRNRSFLNLTSSTLFGIYQPTGFSTEREEPTTPWGTGAETPADSRDGSLDLRRSNFGDNVWQNGKRTPQRARRRSLVSQPQVQHRPRRTFTNYLLPLIGRVAALFGMGVLYALLITHLHDRQAIAPVKVDFNRASWTYLICWGTAAAFLGEALPLVDAFWNDDGDDDERQAKKKSGTDGDRVGGWIDVVRSIGAFVGIAFAIRKLPWQSSLQLSLTFALANPAIWYIVDRSPPGFIMACAVSIGGTIVLLGVNPALVPSPSPAEELRNLVSRSGGLKGSSNDLSGEEMILGIFTEDSVGVATWIASVLFVSSVCFGNIGRRLVPREP